VWTQICGILDVVSRPSRDGGVEFLFNTVKRIEFGLKLAETKFVRESMTSTLPFFEAKRFV
jgi:hypothetical protein